MHQSAATKLRAKEGSLEMLKSEGMKKKWKSFNFKISAQTYLLCFNQANPRKAPTTLLLAHVNRIDTAAVKDASYPFAVYFKGKGSPWILNAGTNAERMEWMEAIQPGSSATLALFAKPHSPPSLNAQCMFSDPQCQVSPSFPEQHATFFSGPSQPQKGDDDDVNFYHPPLGHTQSWPHTLHSSASASQISATRSCSLSSEGKQLQTSNAQMRPPAPSPPSVPAVAFSKGSAIAHTVPRPLPVRPPPRRTCSEADLDEDGYVVLDPLTQSKPKPKFPKPSSLLDSMQNSESSLLANERYLIISEQSFDRQHMQSQENTQSSSDSSSMEQTSTTCSDYLVPNDSSSSDGTTEKGQPISAMVAQMQKAFSPEQVELMLERGLEDQRGGGGGGGRDQPATSRPLPSANLHEGEDSLSANLEKALEVTPDQESYKMLVTVHEDSDEYIPRWAKAVSQDPPQEPTDINPEELALTNDLLMVSKSNLSKMTQIGEGQFGKVFKALLQHRAGAEEVEVAVKTTKAASSEKEKSSFLKEMRIMAVMMHPNIVKLYGLVQDDVDGPWIVLEYLPHGDLKTFLRRNPRPVPQLLKYMVDVSMGMHYLSERGLVHRDLAARNILVGEGET